jgi:hypothetical protein|tara:strand:+ start:726 stop:1970 length:1245 start_codon:yes stop_codon:yes gene_type:complete
MNTNIESYSIKDLYELFSIDEENVTNNMIKSKIIELSDKMKKSQLDDSMFLFLKEAEKKLIKNLNHSGYESNIINFDDKQSFYKNDVLVNSNNNKYYNRDLVDKVLIIDTRYRDNYTSESATHFNVSLPQVIKNVISIQLSDIEFPNTWYTFDESIGNTFFHIRKSLDNNTWYRIDISSGSYYHGDLIESINSYIDTTTNTNINNDLDASFASISAIFNLSFDNAGGTATGQGTISFSYSPFDNSGNATTGDYEFDLDFFSDDPNNVIYQGNDQVRCSKYLGWNLGFRNIQYDYYYGKSTYISESTLDIAGPRYLYLLVDDHNKYVNSNFIPFSNKMSNIKNTIDIFARISLQGSAFSLYNSNSYSVYSDVRKYNGLIDLSRLTISLVDEFGSILNLNNNDYSFTIKATVVQSS